MRKKRDNRKDIISPQLLFSFPKFKLSADLIEVEPREPVKKEVWVAELIQKLDQDIGDSNAEIATIDLENKKISDVLKKDSQKIKALQQQARPYRSPSGAITRITKLNPQKRGLLTGGERMCREENLAMYKNKLARLYEDVNRSEEMKRFWQSFSADFDLAARTFFSDLNNRSGRDLNLLMKIASVDDKAVIQIRWLVENLIAELEKLAASGRPAASQSIAVIARKSTDAANKLATMKKDDFLALTQKWVDWPMLFSRRQREPRKAKDIEKFLSTIQLSEQHPMPNFIVSGWDKNDDAGRVAWRLWEYTDSARERVSQMHKNPDDASWFSPTTLEIKASELPAFDSSPDAYKSWWEVSKGFLLESYPNPLEVPLLRKINDGGKGSRPAVTGMRQPRKNHESNLLFSRLQDKFKSFAGGNKYRVKL
jgi:hypothetical protein